MCVKDQVMLYGTILSIVSTRGLPLLTYKFDILIYINLL